MTDAEMLKLCGDAMGYQSSLRADGTYGIDWDPLHEDAQAMALIKTFDMVIERDDPYRQIGENRECWGVTLFLARPRRRGAETYVVRKCPNLNRAICECVAKMQSGRSLPQGTP